MRLRNKKTGEIATLTLSTNGEDMIIMGNDMYGHITKLSELKDYEDYEEPKEYWCIDCFSPDGLISEFTGSSSDILENRKSIDNYFETKEEAEKAVEKLKAWKLLRDECDIKFDGIIRDDKAMLKGVRLSYDRHQVTFDRMRECMEALHLLFGGEE